MTGRGRNHPDEHQQDGQADELNPARNLDARWAPVRAHRADATAPVGVLRPPDWDWSFPLDGALALKAQEPCATVPSMSPPAPKRRARRTRSRHVDRERRRRRLAVLDRPPRRRRRDAPPVGLRRLGCARPGRSGSGERVTPPAGRPAATGDRRPDRHAAPAAARQPVTRDGDRLPGRHRRRTRALAGRHPGERGAPEARGALGRRRFVRAVRAGTSCRAVSARDRRRSTSAHRQAPTSTHRSTGRSSRSTTSC